MFPKMKFILGVLAMMVVVFHIGHASSEQPQEDEANMENAALLAQQQDESEMNMKASNETRTRKIRIKCRCWIGWQGQENTKYVNFGVIRTFKLLERDKQVKCSASCSAKCAQYFYFPNTKKNYDILCKKIGKPYNYGSMKVGCFSKVGRKDLSRNLWDYDGSPHKLCCKLVPINCKSAYGYGFYWHRVLKLCVRVIGAGFPQYSYCIPQVPNGPRKPPVCCYDKKVYSCLRLKYVISSVKC